MTKAINNRSVKRVSNSFLNRGKTISDISFESKTSTGVKGVQYLAKERRYRVVWKGYYVARLDDFKKARAVLASYLRHTNQYDQYLELQSQVQVHLNQFELHPNTSA